MLEDIDKIDQIENGKSQEQAILTILKEKGYRITNQRKLLIDIIFNEDCTCCKEIYYKAHKKDNTIGIATVYRMLNTLEEIGAIDRRNLYKFSCDGHCHDYDGCKIMMENGREIYLSHEEWKKIISEGLKAKGYIKNGEVETVNLIKKVCMSKACV